MEHWRGSRSSPLESCIKSSSPVEGVRKPARAGSSSRARADSQRHLTVTRFPGSPLSAIRAWAVCPSLAWPTSSPAEPAIAHGLLAGTGAGRGSHRAQELAERREAQASLKQRARDSDAHCRRSGHGAVYLQKLLLSEVNRIETGAARRNRAVAENHRRPAHVVVRPEIHDGTARPLDPTGTPARPPRRRARIARVGAPGAAREATPLSLDEAAA